MTNDGMGRLQDHVQRVHHIDHLLKQANCILMFCQPRRPGKITLRFSEDIPEAGFGIPRTPRVIQWHRHARNHRWYTITLPPTHLTKRAKGKEEFGAAYYHTLGALKTVSELLDARQRAVEILQRLSQRLTNFSKSTNGELSRIETELHQAFLNHSEMRRARKPDQAEWDWFLSGGVTPVFPTDDEQAMVEVADEHFDEEDEEWDEYD